MSRNMERRLRRWLRYRAEQVRCADEYGAQLDAIEAIVRNEKLGAAVALWKICQVLGLPEEE